MAFCAIFFAFSRSFLSNDPLSEQIGFSKHNSDNIHGNGLNCKVIFSVICEEEKVLYVIVKFLYFFRQEEGEEEEA